MIRLPWSVEPRLGAAGPRALLAPLVAVVTTVLVAVVLMSLQGVAPLKALHQLYVAPLSSRYNFSEVLLKMAPLVIIAQGLAIGFRARVWNIGAEGQLILGAIGGSLLPLWLSDSSSVFLLPAMVVCGMAFGAGWAALAAFLRIRFNANEILVTLMLNSIALQLLYYLVSGPLRDPYGFNFPQSALFPPAAMLPTLFEVGRANISVLVALGLTVIAWVFVERSLTGYKLQVGGIAPDAARYAGFGQRRAIWLSLCIGGAAAGLAGVFEVAGPIGQLQRALSPGYGFAAIIVAFLGGLNAIGILFAALFMAVIYVGGDMAQTSAGVPYALNTALQGVLLISYIAARLFTDYRLRWRRREPARQGEL